jgi:hypothetical protein
MVQVDPQTGRALEYQHPPAGQLSGPLNPADSEETAETAAIQRQLPGDGLSKKADEKADRGGDRVDESLDPGHRHFSGLYGLFPSNNARLEPALREAYRR